MRFFLGLLAVGQILLGLVLAAVCFILVPLIFQGQPVGSVLLLGTLALVSGFGAVKFISGGAIWVYFTITNE
jgi:hypothetical protein